MQNRGIARSARLEGHLVYIWLRALIYVCMLVGVDMALAGAQRLMPFHLDPAASRVWFDADARLHSFRGQTQQISGRFTLLNASPPQITDARVTIDAASLATGNGDRDADMHRDYLEVGTFPTIEFRITDLLTPRPVSNGSGWNVILQGTLVVHGVTRTVDVPTSVHLAADRITARGQVRLNIRDYNIRVPRFLVIPMKSEVLVGFEVVARPET